ncbi:MAG: hypothetical protein ABW119_20640 [Candidatus Thiodiazotropha lotti]
MPQHQLRKYDIKKLLVVHRECHIPLQLSMNLIFRVMNITPGVIADKAGIDKSMVYKSLAGLRTPPECLKREMHSVLGMDVWEYKPVKIKAEVYSE